MERNVNECHQVLNRVVYARSKANQTTSEKNFYKPDFDVVNDNQALQAS